MTNMSTGVGDFTSGGYTFEAEGNPLIVESLEQGLKITGPKMEGMLVPRSQGSPTSYVKELHVTANALVHFDSEIAYKTQAEQAERNKKPLPTKPKSHDILDLTTGRLDYAGDASTGTFTVPSAFDLTAKSNGTAVTKEKDKEIVKRFTQTIVFKGTSGTFAINPAAKDKTVPLKSGTIEGPLTFNCLRNETTEGVELPETIKLFGKADRAVIDLEKENTITLSGNVFMEGENGALSGSSEGQTAIVFLDASLNPVRVRMIGKPTTSILEEKKKKTGGGNRK